MTAQDTLRLTSDDLWCLIGEIDPVELVTTQLSGGPGAECPGRVSTNGHWRSEGLVLLDDAHTGVRCLLPASCLSMIRLAALATLAAAELLAPGQVTIGLLASGEAAGLHLATLTRHLPDIGDVALCPGRGRYLGPVGRVRDLLDQAGIGLSVATSAGEAAFGANLLITAGRGHDRLGLGHLARGALLVNAAGKDLRDDLVDGVDAIVVDDAGLIEDNQHRHFARVHRETEALAVTQPLRLLEGWRRPGLEWRSRRHVVGLDRIVAGTHPGRTHVDDVVLVELLGARVLDAALACRLARTALACGVGAWATE